MEYFICANSFAAPFFSDTSRKFQEGTNAEDAMNNFVKDYGHPCGLYAAALYKDANGFHKGEEPLLRWLSNQAKFMQDKTGLIRSDRIGEIEIDGVKHVLDDPKGGSIVGLTS